MEVRAARATGCAIALAWLVVAAGNATAQDASASGSLGVGMFGADPATTIDVGLDAAGDGYAFGLGARLRYLAGEGVRGEDWDQVSEVARMVRYLELTHEGELDASLVVGELGGLTLGNGTLVDAYSAGLDVDHGHLGMSSTARWSRYGGEAFVDDVIAPRIIGARATAVIDRVGLGISSVADLSVPTMDGTTEVVPLLAASAHSGVVSGDGSRDGRAYAELAIAPRTGGGLHLGGAGSVELGAARLAARLEARLSSRGYAPGWIGPLYERQRAELQMRARAGEFGGFGSLAEVGVEVPEVGRATLSHAWRVGQPELAIARISAPYFRGIQAAMWAAVEFGGPAPARAMALEARARLPSSLFIVVETARLYRRTDTLSVPMFEPIWIATAAIGAVLGE